MYHSDSGSRASSRFPQSTFHMTTSSELGDSALTFMYDEQRHGRGTGGRESSAQRTRQPHQQQQEQQQQRPRHQHQRPTPPNGRRTPTSSSTATSNSGFNGRDQFNCPELDQRMKKYLVRLANETANHLIRDTLEPENANLVWKPMASIKGIEILRGYERRENAAAPGGTTSHAKDSTCLRGIADVNASIEEFAMLFKLDSNRALGEHGLLFNPDLLDMATLYSLVQPSGDHPRRYVGIKWCLVQSPSRIFRNRDFCYLECQKEFRDAQGRRGWVRSMHSIKMPCCPSFEKSHGVVRASLYRCGLIAVETDKPGVLDTTYTIEMDLKGHFPELFQPTFLSQRIAALASIDKLLQQQRLSSSPLLGDLDIPTNKVRGSCQFCFREFSTFTRRHVCRKCGEGVCRHCSDDWMLDIPVIGRKKVRICTVCSAEARFCHITPLSARASLAARAGHKNTAPWGNTETQRFNVKYKPMQERSTLQSMPRSVSAPPSEYDQEIDPSEYFVRQLEQEQLREQQDRESHGQYFDADYTSDFDDVYNSGIRDTADLTEMWRGTPSPSMRASYQQAQAQAPPPPSVYSTARRGSLAEPMRRETTASVSGESYTSLRSRAQTLSTDPSAFESRERNHYTHQGRKPASVQESDRPFPPSSRYTVVGNRLERANSFDAARHMEEQMRHRTQERPSHHHHNNAYRLSQHQHPSQQHSRRSHHQLVDGYAGHHHQHQHYPHQPPPPSPASRYDQRSPSNHSSYQQQYHSRESMSGRQSYRGFSPPKVKPSPAPSPAPRNIALEFVTQHLNQQSTASAAAPKPAPLPQAPMFQFGTAPPRRAQPFDDEPEPPQSPEFVGAGEVEYIESASGEWVASRRLDKVPFLDLDDADLMDPMRNVEDTSATRSESGVAASRGSATSGGSSSSDTTIQVSVDVEKVIPLLVERLSQQSILAPSVTL